MKRKIIGVTVGTPISPSTIEDKIKPVKTVNGQTPDENGNVEVIGNKGDDGFSPTISVSNIDGGYKISLTDKNSTKTINVMNGKDGDTYVLTDTDKTDIANLVISKLPTWEGGSY